MVVQVDLGFKCKRPEKNIIDSVYEQSLYCLYSLSFLLFVLSSIEKYIYIPCKKQYDAVQGSSLSCHGPVKATLWYEYLLFTN